jgi:steroid delta-isomerase-like uncharacterized protein
MEGAMSVEENKELIRRFVDAVNRGDLSVIDNVVADDFVDHSRPFLPPGPAGLRAFYEMMGQAVADLRVTLDDVIADGDKVVVRGSATGRHVGELMGIPATGHEFMLRLIDINRIANGKLVERWAVQDDLGFMRQLGVIPTPEADPAG